MRNRNVALLALAAAVWFPAVSARADVINLSAGDMALVLSGSPTEVWDPKGATEIAGNTGANTAYANNTEYALINFNTASTVSQLNSEYGVNNWTITGTSITFYSNFAVAGSYPNNNVFNEIASGNFNLNYLSNNGWVSSSSGGVTWNSLTSTYLPGALDESLGTFNYQALPTGSADPAETSNTWTLGSTSDYINGLESGNLSILGTPADSNVGMLINTDTKGYPAVLTIDATGVPEPKPLGFVLAGLATMSLLRFGRRSCRIASDGEPAGAGLTDRPCR